MATVSICNLYKNSLNSYLLFTVNGTRARAKTCAPVLPQPGLCPLLKLVLRDYVRACGSCKGEKCNNYS